MGAGLISRSVVILGCMLAATELQARTTSWIVQPKACIAETAQDMCTLAIRITTQQLPTDRVCLYLDDTLIRCFDSRESEQTLSIRFRDEAELRLLDANGKQILAQSLDVKGRQQIVKRRRIRQPWSLF